MENSETSIADEARAEAEWRWPIPINYLKGDREHTFLIAQRQAYVLGRLDQASRTVKIESQSELDALPVGTLIEVAFHEHAESTRILRVDDNGASAGNASLRGGKFWSEVWGWADSVTVLYRPGALK